MNVKKMSLKFRFESCETLCFFRGIVVVSSRQWVQKKRKIFSQRSQERSEELSAERTKRAQRPRGTVWKKKVRNIRWHIVLIDSLKTETSNFVLNPSPHWKPVECSEQC